MIDIMKWPIRDESSNFKHEYLFFIKYEGRYSFYKGEENKQYF